MQARAAERATTDPLHAWPEDIAKYRGKYKVGWDVIRKQRFERMKKMGIIGPNHRLTPRASKAWDELTEEEKDEEERNKFNSFLRVEVEGNEMPRLTDDDPASAPDELASQRMDYVMKLQENHPGNNR